MIETLRIENVAIVEHAELEFGPGLNVLTGETGAGKSIVLGALGLLTGARASASLLREGCDTATVACAELCEAELAAYLDGEDWRGKAGGYGIQGAAAEFMELVDGALDTVIGLHVPTVWHLLRRLEKNREKNRGKNRGKNPGSGGDR